MEHGYLWGLVRLEHRDVDKLLYPRRLGLVEQVQVPLVINVIIGQRSGRFGKAHGRDHRIRPIAKALEHFRPGHIQFFEGIVPGQAQIPLDHIRRYHLMARFQQRLKNIAAQIAVCAGKYDFHNPFPPASIFVL